MSLQRPTPLPSQISVSLKNRLAQFLWCPPGACVCSGVDNSVLRATSNFEYCNSSTCNNQSFCETRLKRFSDTFKLPIETPELILCTRAQIDRTKLHSRDSAANVYPHVLHVKMQLRSLYI